VIAWISSYPRSGNTLMRQILYRTMGLHSYSCYEAENSKIREHYEEPNHRVIPSSYYDLPFPEFLDQASKSDELFAIKTHDLPNDDHPALYIVRDGRSAISSFLRFERKFWPNTPITMIDLVRGEHHFGSWSKHYRAWTERPAGRTLVMKFPELVDITPQALNPVAAFLNHTGEIKEWINPLERLRQNPKAEGLFGDGKPTWTCDAEWNEECDRIFWERHGELMRELGFD